MTTEDTRLVTLTAEIVSAHVAHHTVAVNDLPTLITNVYTSLAGLGAEAQPAAEAPQPPAVSVRSSIKADYLVCLEDGKRMKMLKRHLMTDHQMTPDDYRAKWKLPADYPMVASAYAASRRTLALSFGLGKSRSPEPDVSDEQLVETAPSATEETAPAKAPKTRRPAKAVLTKSTSESGDA